MSADWKVATVEWSTGGIYDDDYGVVSAAVPGGGWSVRRTWRVGDGFQCRYLDESDGMRTSYETMEEAQAAAERFYAGVVASRGEQLEAQRPVEAAP